MNCRKILTMIMAISLILMNYQSFAQTAEELLPKAIQLEEVQGELEQAIEVYQTIVTGFPENRPIAARAYLHMGRCYEKLGKKDAQKAYNMVIHDYADQDEMVKEAKARLAVLGQSGSPVQNKGLMVRKVWDGPDVDMMGEPSPDGKYISIVEWNTGNLAIYEVATGKKRILTKNGSWDDPNQFAENSRWSPDGKQIVYDWFNEDNPGWIDFYVVDLDGSEPRKLWSNNEMEWAQCYDWSPDGKQILACFGKKDMTKHIGLVSVQDGSLQLIKDLGGGQSWPKCMRFSRDGRYVVYDNPPENDNPARDIFLLSTDGSSETQLVEHPSNDYVLGWAPDGRGIFFASDRNGGTLSSYFVHIADRKPFGEPILVMHNMGPVEPMGFTKKGSFYYGFLQRLTDIYIAELDRETGMVDGPTQKAIRAFEGFNQTPAYSPDGKTLAYISRRSPIFKPYGRRWGGNVLCIKSLETGKERELHPDIGLFAYPSWSPDGKSLFLVYWTEDERVALSRIDAQTGDIMLALRHEDKSHFGGHQCSPSGKMLYYGLSDSKAKSSNIIARDLESGKETIIYSDKRYFTFSLSPDGQWLALGFQGSNASRLELLSTAGEGSRELYKFNEGVELRGNPSAIWTVDGTYLLLSVRYSNSDSDSYELCRIPANGGEPEKLGLKIENGFHSLSVHPDGRHIIFSTIEQDVEEVWVMENFLNIAGSE
jgi:Tol biopolymer transport system component